ncbi:MAG TPA: hypothetical protein VFC07_00560, partial [Verrucomicrobiae bacterium]|nr:hypothetical protein [Verrucomicrobiae bacterium]
MKTIKTLISLAGLTGGLFAVPVVMAADAAAPAESTTPAIANPAAVPEVAPAATSTADTNTAADNGEKTIRLSFKDAPMETVLTYLSKAAGFVIHPMVTPSGRVTVTAEQPVSKEEALLL